MKDNTETAVTLSSLRKQNSKILMLQVNGEKRMCKKAKHVQEKNLNKTKNAK